MSIGWFINLVTFSRYSHAALCINEKDVVHALPINGSVIETTIDAINDRYEVDRYKFPANISLEENELRGAISEFKNKYNYSKPFAVAGALAFYCEFLIVPFFIFLIVEYYFIREIKFFIICLISFLMYCLLVYMVKPERSNKILRFLNFRCRVPENETICSHLVVHVLKKFIKASRKDLSIPLPRHLPKWCIANGILKESSADMNS